MNSIYRCPSCQGPLQRTGSTIQCEECSTSYRKKDGYIDFLGEAQDQTDSWIAENLFDWIHPIYESVYFPLLYRLGALPANHSVADEVDDLVHRTRTKNGRVLDVACGTGRLTRKLAEVNQSVHGIDLSGGMLEQAVNRTSESMRVKLDYGRARAEKLPFGNDSFDAVTCSGAIYFFPDLDRVLNEIKRVLRPGSRFAGMTVVHDGWLGTQPGKLGLQLYQQFERYEVYKRDEFFDRLRANGFRDIHGEVHGCFLLFDALSK